MLPKPIFGGRQTNDGYMFCARFSTSFSDRPDITVREAVAPLYKLYESLSQPEAHVFICHATEDKSTAKLLASFLSAAGPRVWFDQWEVHVGDSIVEKINAGLGSATHLVVLLSAHSVGKPWVSREMSSALMRQLADRSIQVLPLRLDDSGLPPLIADIRYADCRTDIYVGFRDLLNVILQKDARNGT